MLFVKGAEAMCHGTHTGEDFFSIVIPHTTGNIRKKIIKLVYHNFALKHNEGSRRQSKYVRK